MKIASIFFVCITFLSPAMAQKYEKYVKELEAKGLPYFYNDEVEKSIEAWVTNPNGSTVKIIDNSNYFFEDVMRIQTASGLPWFCKYIAAANTGLDVDFKETDGPAGIWPLPFNIGRKYSLVQNYYLDERKSIEKSTEAASQYLKDLQFIYKDWLKTIVAFKIGPLKMNQTIRLAGNSLKFEDIYTQLDAEGKLAIIQFYGAVVSMHLAKNFGLPEYEAKPNMTAVVTSEANLPFSMIEQFTGISSNDLKFYNPELKENIVPYFGRSTEFKIPKSKILEYKKYKDTMIFIVHESEKPKFVIDTLITIIDSVENVEYSKREVEKNSTQVGKKVIKEYNTKTGAKPTTDNYAWSYYTIKAGDGFYTLSDVFDCTIPQLKQWNGIYNNNLIAGVTLKFYVKASLKNYYDQINYMTFQQKRNLALKD